MLEEIAVKNYRTFASHTRFKLVPLTILIGANSSGKSSVTRLFPLLNQSLVGRSAAPILWVSDELDYGSFEDNVHRYNKLQPISFSFSSQLHKDQARRYYAPGGPLSMESAAFEYEISVLGSDHRTYIDSITFSIYGERVVLHFDDRDFLRKLEFRNRDYSSIINGRDIRILQHLFPAIYTVDKDNTVSMTGLSGFLTDAIRLLRQHAHQNTSFQTIQSAVGTYIGPIDALVEHIKDRVPSIGTLYKNIDGMNRPTKERLWLLFFMSALRTIIAAVSDSVASDITSGSYLAPVRASAKRYYRRQELAIDQIDPAGGNLAMYLNSLSFSELAAINDDMMEYFDHSVQVTRGEGHISLRLEARGEAFSDNLADVGFGFSQLIPVLAQIHSARRNARAPSRSPVYARGILSPIIAIEQPELHLHPAYQSRLGAYFVHAASRARSSEVASRFLIETHSEPLVNEVASLVGQGKIDPNDVKIYLFEQASGHATSQVVEANIMADGSIPKWPFGFFTTGKLDRAPAFQ